MKELNPGHYGEAARKLSQELDKLDKERGIKVNEAVDYFKKEKERLEKGDIWNETRTILFSMIGDISECEEAVIFEPKMDLQVAQHLNEIKIRLNDAGQEVNALRRYLKI